MKRFLSFLLIFTLLTLSFPAAALAAGDYEGFIFDDTPRMTLLETQADGNDVLYVFSQDCGDAAATERERLALWDLMLEEFGTDERVAAALELYALDHPAYKYLIYPIVLQVEVIARGFVVHVGYFPVTADRLTLSLARDILPALERTNLYRRQEFTFQLSFCAAVKNAPSATRASASSESGVLASPATMHISYTLPEDAENPNPAFLTLPRAGDYALQRPSRTGYFFDYWQNTRTGAAVEAVPANADDFSVSAHWTPRTYAVRYVLSTREPGYLFQFVNNNGNPTEHVYGENTPLYAPVAPNGYVFGGWFADAAFTGDPMEKIPADLPGDAVLYARWFTPEEAEDYDIAQARWCDLDNDGEITPGDARIALRQSLGLQTLSRTLIARADFTRTGTFTPATARQILRISLGLDNLKDVLRYYELI